MATEVTMPRLSDTMDSGTVARWLKSEGDAIKRGDIIAEIETDKANMELESYASGVLAQILVNEGQSAGLGQPIAVIAASAEEAQTLRNGTQTAPSAEAGPPSDAPTEPEATAAVESGEAPVTDPVAPVEPEPMRHPDERLKVSPLARRLAQEQGIELSTVTGSGPGGRIVKRDVQAALRQSGTAIAPQPTAESGARQTAPLTPEAHGTGPREAQAVEMTRMQQTIARRMTEAKFSAPEFVLTAELDMTEAQAMLAGVKRVEGAPRVGPSDLLLRALALALNEHPEVNAGWENGGIVRYGRINVGFAVAIPGGLVVPVVHDANTKSLGQIAHETKGLIERARGGKMAPAEYEGGTFSISNLGMYGIDQFTPVINTPEACILGVGAITPKPVVADGQVVVRDRMRVTLSCDHRVVNGAQGAEFLQTVRRLLEHPILAVL